jgi:NADH-quinone oxidoreductase subunit M
MQGPVRGNALVSVAGGPGAATDPSLGARKAITDLGARERWVLAPMVILILLLGFYPKPLLDIVNPSVGATIQAVTVQEGK